MSTDKPQEPEEPKQQLEQPTPQYEVSISNQPQEDENVKLTRSKFLNSIRISLALLVPGILSLALSITANSQVLAFIGLGLTFWGALFLFVRPLHYVESSLLDSTALSAYLTIDRITKDLKQKGKAYYIPPYPEEVYLPNHLKGLKDMVIFISTETAASTPSIEEMAKGKFFLENPEGICITPPGLGLLAQIEKELKRDLTKLDLNELCEALSQLIPENLQLAREAELKLEDNKQVYLKLVDSAYKRLYTQQDLKSVATLGCPLVSAVACAIAKSTGKAVHIAKTKTTPDQQTTETWIRITED
jgi:hypothetical protein